MKPLLPQNNIKKFNNIDIMKKKIIVDENKFLGTYTNYQQQLVREFLKANKLKKNGYTKKQISKMMKLTNSTRLYHWFVQNKTPYPLKSLEFLKRKGLIPLTYNTPGLKTILRIFAWCYGDGTIGKNDCYICLSGEKEELEKVANEIKAELGFETKITRMKFKGRESCFHLEIQGRGNRILGRLLVAMGAPIGNKVLKTFYLPDWLINAPKWIKIEFLDVLFANEIKSPMMDKNKVSAVKTMSLRLSKNEEMMEEHKVFLKQIKNILEEMKIETSNIFVEKGRYKRMDDVITASAGFNILTNHLNFLRFSNIFKFEYCKYKEERLKNIKNKVIESLKRQLHTMKLYEEAMIIHKTNKSWIRVAKNMNLPEGRVRSWFEGNKPRLYNKRREIKKCLKKNMM